MVPNDLEKMNIFQSSYHVFFTIFYYNMTRGKKLMSKSYMIGQNGPKIPKFKITRFLRKIEILRR